MTSPILDLRRLQRRLLAVVALCVLAAAPAARAQAPSAPDALVKHLTEDVLNSIKADKDIQAGSIPKIQSLVESKVLPYTNFTKMTASALGRNWSQASPEQREQITDQFRQLLIYTYAGALSNVRDQRVEYRPFRADPSDTVVQVNTRVVNPRGGEPIQLDYKLEKTNADWKIIDVNVLGVWLVENYRNSFQQEVSRGGIDGLIKTLTSKNQQLASGAGAAKS